ncbi:MAG: hypothetical protein Q7T58_05155 [Methylotenera sp.]|nr:hypothetical protein [Methylotenera sp.]
MNKNEMFDSLVGNAMDFLSKAIEEFDTHPKYSVIHFHAAVELIIKARLMHEHWSLIVAKGNEPDWDKFVAGDFQSVTLDEAANRLQRIVQSGLTQTEIESFRNIAKHRNKMLHFFHVADKSDQSLKQDIARQQLKAWYYLHQLIGERWRDVFASHSNKISEIDQELRGLHDFLQVIFDNLKAKILEAEYAGFVFTECPSCKFKAQEHEPDIEVIYVADCLVCGLIETCVKIECKNCNEVVTFSDEGHTNCLGCGAYHNHEDLAEALIDQGVAFIAAKEGNYDAYIGNCADCDGYHTVVQVKETETWFCTECFIEPKQMVTCEWCNELSSVDMEGSYVRGCNQCEGMSGWHEND